MKKSAVSKCVVYILLGLVSLVCVIPFVMVLSASFSQQGELIKNGYGILPRGFSTEAYKIIFRSPGQLLSAYRVTIFVTIVGSALNLMCTALMAYPLSRKEYKWRSQLSFYIYFTMLFSGGAIPSYILITQYLHLKDNILVLIIPGMFNAWNSFLLRTYFSQIPDSVVEAARIDGANEYKIFFMLALPMAKVGLITVLMLVMLANWNEWYMCFMYMSTDKTISLQYYLYRVLSDIESMLSANMSSVVSMDTSTLPNETVRMAMCVLAAGPMVFVFAFFQKYFVGGLALGSVKG